VAALALRIRFLGLPTIALAQLKAARFADFLMPRDRAADCFSGWGFIGLHERIVQGAACARACRNA
jgi:hypothetical protein